MTTKKSFIVFLRIFFVSFSLYFMQDAFYLWDGYSYYMRFTDFLPELSLAFILWTIFVVITIFILWLILYGLSRIFPIFLKNIRFEHILTGFIFIVVLRLIKKFFLKDFYLGDLPGSSNFIVFITAGMFAAVFVWFVRKYADKIIDEINTRITPLVWLFAVLLIIAVPLSFLKQAAAGSEPHNSSVSKKTNSSNEKRPNIVLVTMDALTAFDMQLYGYKRQTTPFISEWAKDAVVFNKVYASSNWTAPTTMSLMTGQMPWTHRMWYRTKYRIGDNNENNFPRILKDNGYDVYGFIQNGFADVENLGIKDAFSVRDKYYTFYIPREGWWFDKIAEFFRGRPIAQEWIFGGNIFSSRINAFAPPVRVTQRRAELVYNRFLNYLSQKKQVKESVTPFFVWLHVIPPHAPYLPPKKYYGVFGDAEKFSTHEEQQKYIYEYKPDKQAEVDILRKRYDEHILYSDEQFKLFLARLAGLVDMSNTIIIFSADHGEVFSHGYQSHDGKDLYEPVVRLPLVIRAPERIKSRNVDMSVSQIDIAPTILELAGISAPSWMEGRSLLPLIWGKPLESKPIFSMQLIQNRSFGHPIEKGTIAVWDGDYKLVYYLDGKKEPLLFNLQSDPDEINNLYQQKPDISQRLKKLIDDNLSLANKKIMQAK